MMKNPILTNALRDTYIDDIQTNLLRKNLQRIVK